MNKPVKMSYSQPSNQPESHCLQLYCQLPGSVDLSAQLATKIEIMTPSEMRGLSVWLKQRCYEVLRKRAAERKEDFPEFDEFRL